MEDGVEVIVNHIEPYKIKGEPSTFGLKEELVIDLEKENIVELGLTKPGGFDVNSEGDIYIFDSSMSDVDLVYRFDRNGNFVTSFGKKGQGPGEVQFAHFRKIARNNEIPIVDSHGHKFLIFDKDGSLIKETRLDSQIAWPVGSVIPLDNGNYLIRRIKIYPEEKSSISQLWLYDSEFNEIKILDSLKTREYWMEKIWKWPFDLHLWIVSKNRIYVGSEDKGYEIWVYDLEGNLLRKIKKEYRPVEIPRKIRKRIHKLVINPRSTNKSVLIPKYYHPIQNFFTDDEGRLFVVTSEKGENQKEYVFRSLEAVEFIYDIFNPDGVFIGKKSMKLFFTEAQFWITIKKNRLYSFRVKESGYRELVVYRMIWE